jgi:CRP-like cAMP-binding protein
VRSGGCEGSSGNNRTLIEASLPSRLASLLSSPIRSVQMDIDLLRMVSILRDLDDTELTNFQKLLTPREIKAKERILEEGTHVEHFYIICDGTVHIRRLAQKREMLMGRLGAGAFFGEINFFDPGVATASIYAMTRTLVAMVDYASLRCFMESNPATGYKLVSAMMTETVRRLRTTSAKLVHSVYWSSAAAAGS